MPPRKLQQPNWPDGNTINYDDPTLLGLNEQQIPKGIVTKVRRFADVDTDELLHGINNMQDLENNILLSINNCNEFDPEQVMSIFHKIEIWGGNAAGRFYTMDGGFKTNFNLDSYIDLIKLCVVIKYDGIKSLEAIYDKASRCIQQCNRLGVSYITKHIYYWTRNNWGDHALPVFDKKLSLGLYHVMPSIDQAAYYWEDMIEKSKKHGISTFALERKLFNHFSAV